MPSPQIIIFLAPDGSIRAESPGPNGARRKLDLPREILESPEIQSELAAQQIEMSAQRERIALAASQADAERARAQKLDAERECIHAERAARIRELTPEQRQAMIERINIEHPLTAQRVGLGYVNARVARRRPNLHISIITDLDI